MRDIGAGELIGHSIKEMQRCRDAKAQSDIAVSVQLSLFGHRGYRELLFRQIKPRIDADNKRGRGAKLEYRPGKSEDGMVEREGHPRRSSESPVKLLKQL